jgi:hypothetical protein
VVHRVPGAGGDDPGKDGAGAERQVADQVEEFVAGGLIGETEGVVDGAVGADDQQVAGRQVREQAGAAGGLGLFEQAEGSGGGDLAGVAVGAVGCAQCDGGGVGGDAARGLGAQRGDRAVREVEVV